MRSQIYRHPTDLIYYDLELNEQITMAVDDGDLHISTSSNLTRPQWPYMASVTILKNPQPVDLAIHAMGELN
jgi:hypothetical protein